MEFYCFSLTHQTTSLDIREKFSCSGAETRAALFHYARHNEQYLGPSSEIAILSTCNRYEVYLTFPNEMHAFAGKEDEAARVIAGFIVEITGYAGADLASLFHLYRNLEAAEHIFRVAAGLESQVIGEVQILGQVSEALEAALQAGSAHHTLASLFRAALHTAKRAHTETAIGKHPASISSAAASIAEQIMGKVDTRPILIIGAGEMSALATRAFHARGAQKITIVNRSYDRAARLAKQYACRALPWEEIGQALQLADVVVSATSAQQYILTREKVSEIMLQRKNPKLLLMDIALPRDIEPATRDLPGVTVYNLDDLNLRLNQTLELRKNEAQQVEVILQEELSAFAHWMEVIPTVGKLHRKAEKIRQQEVERMMQHLPGLDPQVQDQIELLTRSLVKKLFHEPSSRMRNEVRNGEIGAYMNTLQFLFGLDEDDSFQNERPGHGNHGR